MVCVTSKLALIESTSCANVRRRISSPYAGGPQTARPKLAHARHKLATSVARARSNVQTLREWRKILSHLRAIREHGRQQPGERPQSHGADEDHELQCVDGEAIRDRAAAAGEHGRAQIRQAMSTGDPERAADDRQRAGL